MPGAIAERGRNGPGSTNGGNINAIFYGYDLCRRKDLRQLLMQCCRDGNDALLDMGAQPAVETDNGPPGQLTKTSRWVFAGSVHSAHGWDALPPGRGSAKNVLLLPVGVNQGRFFPGDILLQSMLELQDVSLLLRQNGNGNAIVAKPLSQLQIVEQYCLGEPAGHSIQLGQQGMELCLGPAPAVTGCNVHDFQWGEEVQRAAGMTYSALALRFAQMGSNISGVRVDGGGALQ